MLFSPITILRIHRQRKALNTGSFNRNLLTDKSGQAAEGDRSSRDGLTRHNPAPQNSDLSYKDALLDAQARYFFSVEYKHAEPSPDVLNRLFAQIDTARPAANNMRPIRSGFTTPTATSIYRAFSQPLLGRLLPGSVAVMLLVMILGPNVSQMLRGGDSGLYVGPLYERTLTVQNGPERLPVSSLELMIGEQLDAPLEYNPQDASILDPVELGVEDDTRRTRLQFNQRGLDNYKKSKFGPQ